MRPGSHKHGCRHNFIAFAVQRCATKSLDQHLSILYEMFIFCDQEKTDLISLFIDKSLICPGLPGDLKNLKNGKNQELTLKKP